MVKRAKWTLKNKSLSDVMFDVICNLFLVLFVIVVFYPLYFVLVASFTEPTIVNTGKVLLYPEEFMLDGYQKVFSDPMVWTGYGNTIIYTVCGAIFGTIVVVMAGYGLSRKEMPFRGLVMKFLIFSMYFGGGMIPLYLVVRTLGLVNTRLIIVVLGSASVYNCIVVRSFMSANIPEELFDAARIDGCGHGTFFVKVVVPLSKAVVSVIVLWIAVGQWNSYFTAMMYLTDSNKYPLQLYLREVLEMTSNMANSHNEELMQQDPELWAQLVSQAQVIKYSIIVVATAPILCVYPFIQKYFVKGVMIGSVKG